MLKEDRIAAMTSEQRSHRGTSRNIGELAIMKQGGAAEARPDCDRHRRQVGVGQRPHRDQDLLDPQRAVATDFARIATFISGAVARIEGNPEPRSVCAARADARDKR